MDVIRVENDGQDIVETNYFDTRLARRGYFYLSTNAGCMRLLVPDSQVEEIAEFRTAEYAILSRGPWPEQARTDALELLFEDLSDNPYALHMVVDQCDILPDGEGEWTLAVWSREGKQFECPLKYRHVAAIPCLESWGGGKKYS